MAGIVNEAELTTKPVLLSKLNRTLSPTPPTIEQFGRVYDPCAFSVGVHPVVVAPVVGSVVSRVGAVKATCVNGTSGPPGSRSRECFQSVQGRRSASRFAGRTKGNVHQRPLKSTHV